MWRLTHPKAFECAFNKSFHLEVEWLWVSDPLQYFLVVCFVRIKAATSFFFALQKHVAAQGPELTFIDGAWRFCCKSSMEWTLLPAWTVLHWLKIVAYSLNMFKSAPDLLPFSILILTHGQIQMNQINPITSYYNYWGGIKKSGFS